MRLAALVVVLLAGVAVASRYECWERDPAHPSPATRSCKFRDVCVQRGQWYFGRSMRLSQQEEDELANGMVTLGTYEAHDKLSFIIETDDEFRRRGKGGAWQDSVGVLYYSPSHMYYHWLADDMLGLYDLLDRHGVLPAGPADRGVRLIYPSSQYSQRLGENAAALFSDGPILEAAKLGPQHRLCFSTLIAGPAGINLAGTGIAHVDAAYVLRFRDWILRRMLGPQPPLQLRDVRRPIILVLQRTTSRRVHNDEELADALQSSHPSWDVRLVELEAMPWRDQLDLLRRTSVLVGTHGSGLGNAMFLPVQSPAQTHKVPVGMVEIFPHKFTRITFERLAAMLGISYRRWFNHHKENAIFDDKPLAALSPAEAQAVKDDPQSIYKSWAANLYWVNQDIKRVPPSEIEAHIVSILRLRDEL